MLRFHLFQIFYNCAYYNGTCDLLEEPHFVIDEHEVPLGNLRKYAEVADLLSELRESYIGEFKKRINALITWSCSRSADILVFPEYSIPAVLLPYLRDLSKERNIWIVAGSHRAKYDEQSLEAYRLVGLSKEVIEQGAAYVPLISPNGDVSVYPKEIRSKWEIDLRVPEHSGNRVCKIQRGENVIPIAILPCIEALNVGSVAKVLESSGVPRVIVCPSCSPSTQQFAEMGAVLSSHEILLAYVNNASFGKTSLRIPDHLKPYFRNIATANYDVVANEEAVLEVDLSTEPFHMARKTILNRTMGNAPQVFPIVYATQAPWVEEYNAFKAQFLDLLKSFDSQDAIELGPIRDLLAEYLAENGSSLPAVLEGRVRKLLREVLPVYDGSIETAMNLLGVAEIDNCASPKEYAAVRVDRALHTLMAMIVEKDSNAISELLDALKRLKDYQGALPRLSKAVPTAFDRVEDKRPTQAEVELIGAFQNRGNELDRLRDAFKNNEVTAIFLSGPSGIGKSDLHTVFFRKLLPDWSPLTIRVTEKSGVPKLLSAIGRALGKELDIDAVAEASTKVFRHHVVKLCQRLEELGKTALILDDIGSILRSHSGRDAKLMSEILQVITSASAELHIKVIIVSSITPPAPWTRGPKTTHIRLTRIDDRYAERIIERDLRRLMKDHPGPDTRQLLELAKLAGGHPLTARLLAEAANSALLNPPKGGDVISEVANKASEQLLTSMNLSGEEEKCLELLSVFRIPIIPDLLAQVPVFGGCIEHLRALGERVLLSYDGVTIEQHPLLGRYYQWRLNSGDMREAAHRGAAEYYEALIDRSDKQKCILECAELSFHLLSIGDHEKAITLRAFVLEEVKPLAKQKYKQHDYLGAYELYRVLRDVSPYDPEILASLARCHGRFLRWDDCRIEFENAISSARARGMHFWWLYRDWGQLLSRYDRIEEANEKFEEAEKNFHGQNDASLKGTRAYNCAKQGNYAGAIELYEEALKLNKYHRYSLYYYERLLRTMGNISRAEEIRETLDYLDSSNDYSIPEEYEIDWYDD